MSHSGALHARLLRDFIKDSLYNLRQGYFSSQVPLGFLEKPINFQALAGKAAYLSAVQRQYTELQVSWLTPVEIFSPHLGASIANYLVKHSSKDHPLHIFEIGGGTGTLARDILTWLQNNAPHIHHSCRYKIIEISPMLAEVQQKRVTHNGSMHSMQFDVVRGDALDPNSYGHPSYDPCFVIAMEVFDNLPHDKVLNHGKKDEWYETHVVDHRIDNHRNGSHRNSLHYEERAKIVQDELIQRCLQAWLRLMQQSREGSLNSLGDISNLLFGTKKDKASAPPDDAIHYTTKHRSDNGSSSQGMHAYSRPSLLSMIKYAVGNTMGDCVFLPTCALQLFDTLHAVRPHHKFVGADFDYLPETTIEGWNAPLVATTVDGTTVDHNTYLVDPGTADIFFPSDFELLAALYNERRHSRERAVKYMKAGAFFKEWAPDETSTCTQDGYDPLLSDYSNTSVLLS